jgi:hypothetical protein
MHYTPNSQLIDFEPTEVPVQWDNVHPYPIQLPLIKVLLVIGHDYLSDRFQILQHNLTAVWGFKVWGEVMTTGGCWTLLFGTVYERIPGPQLMSLLGRAPADLHGAEHLIVLLTDNTFPCHFGLLLAVSLPFLISPFEGRCQVAVLRWM